MSKKQSKSRSLKRRAKKAEKGPTRAQLQRRIEQLERRLAIFQRGDTLRQEGEHWYELREFFEGEEIKRIPGPWKEPVFLMGMLSNVYVLEVPATATSAEITRFLDLLKRNGIAPALTIRNGVRFLKLATVDSEMEKHLDAAEMEPHGSEEAEGPGPDIDDADRAGPESSGNGVGDPGPEDEPDHSGGSAPDIPVVEGGQAGDAGGGD